MARWTTMVVYKQVVNSASMIACVCCQYCHVVNFKSTPMLGPLQSMVITISQESLQVIPKACRGTASAGKRYSFWKERCELNAKKAISGLKNVGLPTRASESQKQAGHQQGVSVKCGSTSRRDTVDKKLK